MEDQIFPFFKKRHSYKQYKERLDELSRSLELHKLKGFNLRWFSNERKHMLIILLKDLEDIESLGIVSDILDALKKSIEELLAAWKEKELPSFFSTFGSRLKILKLHDDPERSESFNDLISLLQVEIDHHMQGRQASVPFGRCEKTLYDAGFKPSEIPWFSAYWEKAQMEKLLDSLTDQDKQEGIARLKRFATIVSGLDWDLVPAVLKKYDYADKEKIISAIEKTRSRILRDSCIWKMLDIWEGNLDVLLKEMMNDDSELYLNITIGSNYDAGWIRGFINLNIKEIVSKRWNPMEILPLIIQARLSPQMIKDIGLGEILTLAREIRKDEISGWYLWFLCSERSFFELVSKKIKPRFSEYLWNKTSGFYLCFIRYYQDFCRRVLHENAIQPIPGMIITNTLKEKLSPKLAYRRWMEKKKDGTFGEFQKDDFVSLKDHTDYIYLVKGITEQGYILYPLIGTKLTAPVRATELIRFKEDPRWRNIRHLNEKGFLIVHSVLAFYEDDYSYNLDDKQRKRYGLRQGFLNLANSLEEMKKKKKIRYPFSACSVHPDYPARFVIQEHGSLGMVFSDGFVQKAYFKDSWTSVTDEYHKTSDHDSHYPVEMVLTAKHIRHPYHELTIINTKIKGLYYSYEKTPPDHVHMLMILCLDYGLDLFEISYETGKHRVFPYSSYKERWRKLDS